jgi:hypothetical protein
MTVAPVFRGQAVKAISPMTSWRPEYTRWRLRDAFARQPDFLQAPSVARGPGFVGREGDFLGQPEGPSGVSIAPDPSSLRLN